MQVVRISNLAAAPDLNRTRQQVLETYDLPMQRSAENQKSAPQIRNAHCGFMTSIYFSFRQVSRHTLLF